MVMVTTRPGKPGTAMNGFGVGIGEFFNPTPTELWDGMDAGQFPNMGTVPVSEIQIAWEFGTTTGNGSYTVTDQSLDPQPVSDSLTVVGPDGAIYVTGMTVPLSDTLVDGLAIAAIMPGISNEEGFYRSLFEGQDSFVGSKKADTLISFDGRDDVRGNAGNDTIDTGKGRDTAKGGKGNDLMDLGAGNDIGQGGSGRDRINGEAGNDSIIGGGGRDFLSGGGGSDSLGGGAGNDVLKGGNGADNLEGGIGNDTLRGGAGPDDFRFWAPQMGTIDLGTDTIMDFEFMADKIDFENTNVQFADLVFGTYMGGTQITVNTSQVQAVIRVEDTDIVDFSQTDFIFSMI